MPESEKEKVNPMPEGYPGITPMLSIRNAMKGIEFYTYVFGAVQTFILKDKNGSVFHSELKIGKGVLMVAEEDPNFNKGPLTLGENSAFFWIYVENVDDVYGRAIKNGAISISEPENQFFGDRMCRINDPFGYIWLIASHVEDVSEEELKRRGDELG